MTWANPVLAIDVAGDGACQHDAAARPRSLQNAPREQHRHVGGGHAAGGPAGEQHQPTQEHALAPKAVGQAAIGHREESHRQHRERQRELRHAGRDPERLLHRRHGRDEQMDRERPDEGDGDQRDEEIPARPEGHGHAV
jgi:hypothetical protein